MHAVLQTVADTNSKGVVEGNGCGGCGGTAVGDGVVGVEPAYRPPAESLDPGTDPGISADPIARDTGGASLELALAGGVGVGGGAKACVGGECEEGGIDEDARQTRRQREEEEEGRSARFLGAPNKNDQEETVRPVARIPTERAVGGLRAALEGHRRSTIPKPDASDGSAAAKGEVGVSATKTFSVGRGSCDEGAGGGEQAGWVDMWSSLVQVVEVREKVVRELMLFAPRCRALECAAFVWVAVGLYLCVVAWL